MYKMINDPSNILLSKLIECKSITPDDNGCHHIILNRLQAIGFECEKINFGEVKNLWALLKSKDGPTLCFLGHTDVVPPGPIDEWDSNPFYSTERDGFIYGRGAADMKSGLAAMVTAVEKFLSDKESFCGSIAFLITSDEEGPAINGTKKVIKELIKRDQKIDWCIVGEPSSEKLLGDTIKIGRRGSLTGFIKIIGCQGHVAYPHLAKNPFKMISPIISDLNEIEWDQGNDFFPPTNFEIVDINSSNRGINVIPGEVELVFNVRFNNLWDYESIKNTILKIVSSHGIDCELKWKESGIPFLSEKGRLIEIAQNVIKKECFKKPKLSTGGGTSDGRFVAPYVPEIIELGSINETIHKVNERVRTEDTPKLSKIYYKIMKDLFV